MNVSLFGLYTGEVFCVDVGNSILERDYSLSVMLYLISSTFSGGAECEVMNESNISIYKILDSIST